MRRWLVRASCLVALGLGVVGCAAAIARNPVPPALENQASVVGMGPAPIRFWGDQLPPNADAIVKEKWAQVARHPAGAPGQWPPSRRQFPRAVGRRQRRRVRGRRAWRLDRLGQAAGVRPRHRGVDRCAHRAIRLSRPKIRCSAQRCVHHLRQQGYRHRPANTRPAWWRLPCQQRAARQGRRALRQRGVPGGGRRRAPQRAPPPDRHHQSRCRAPGDLGHGRDRDERQPRGARAVPYRAAVLCGDPGRVPAGLHQGRRRRRNL